MELQTKQIVIENQLIKYLETKGEKTPIILLHGWRSEAKIWTGIMEALNAEGHPLHALDLPGFGGSELPKRAFSVSDYSDIVLGFMEKLNIRKAIIIGHSFGGRVGIKLASEHADKIDKLIIVDGGGIKNKSWGLEAKKIIAKIVKPIFKLPGTQKLRKKIYQNMGAEDYVATPLLRDIFLNVLNEDLQESLAKITIPTLVVWGENDTTTPVLDGKRMHELVKKSKLEILPNAGHFSFLDQPDTFIHSIQKFLND